MKMKKLIAVVLTLAVSSCALIACGGSGAGSEKKGEGVMTYGEYVAAPVDSEVTVETYVQAANAWWDGKITLYTQDKDGGYFIYDMPCSEEDAAKLTPGTKIKVKGYKSEWSGEVEIIDATFEIEDGSYIAQAEDVTEYLGKDELENHMNEFVSFKGLVIEPSKDADGNEAPFLYNWDGSGEVGNDVYFNVSKDGQTYTFLVRAYLTGQDTGVYKTAETLKVGDTIDCEGFLYWYEGVNPHITNITIK
ncbi:MAG: hypothetical protein K6E49_05515 [Lachnospiraceae bacterium]|nr:hypothetical protein [Lachnospiraceae bacterium]